MNEPVRLAVVGAGTIGKRHIAAIAASPNVELVAIADPVLAEKGLAEQHNAAFYTDYQQLLTDHAPDGVIVATPTEHHLEPARVALARGAHVLVEKPITASVVDAQMLVRESAAANLHVLVGHHRRYYPLLEVTRSIVQDGQIGDLIAAHVQWSVRKHDDYFQPDWRKREAAGPVLTNLVHEIDCLRYICGEVNGVTAKISNAARGFAKEDTAAVIIEMASGALVTALLSDATPSPWAWEFATGENPAFPAARQNAWRFCGSEGALEFPNLVVWRQRDGEQGWQYPMQAEAVGADLGDAYANQCVHFCAVIRGIEKPRIDARDATRTLAATLAVLESAKSGNRIALPTSASH